MMAINEQRINSFSLSSISTQKDISAFIFNQEPGTKRSNLYIPMEGLSVRLTIRVRLFIIAPRGTFPRR